MAVGLAVVILHAIFDVERPLKPERDPNADLPYGVTIYRDAYIAGELDVEQFERELDRLLLAKRPAPLALNELRSMWHEGREGIERIQMVGGGEFYVQVAGDLEV